jgi:hypothetical protein
MTSKRVLGILAAIALVALSATGAQAGHGGMPSALTSFFVCNSISGEDAGRSVTVDSSTFAFNPQNVRIGNATLACAFAKLLDPITGVAIEPNPGADLAKQNLKCYSISVQRGQPSSGHPPTYIVTDELAGTDSNVTGSSLQYICAPASILQKAQ